MTDDAAGSPPAPSRLPIAWCRRTRSSGWTRSASTGCTPAACTIGAVVRMLSEERLLVERYPEYREYMRRQQGKQFDTISTRGNDGPIFSPDVAAA